MAMKTIPTSLALLAAFSLVLGCQRAGDTDIESATRQVKAQHTGPEQHLIEALYRLDLRPDQRKAMDGLMANAQLRLLPVKQAVADLMREAARGIRKGEVNAVRLKVLAENIKGEFHKARPFVIATLNSVHKTLDKGQREQLVATLRERHRARMAERFGSDMDRPGFHGHGHGLGHGLGHGRGHGLGHGRGHMHRGHHRMRRIAEKLGLSKGQRGRIKDVIHRGIAAMQEGQQAPKARWHKRHEKIRAAVRSFLSDDFDAAELPFLDRPHGPGLDKLDRILKVGKLVLPILSQQQRDKIATHLEFRADIVAPPTE
jgi:hypothetical protein